MFAGKGRDLQVQSTAFSSKKRLEMKRSAGPVKSGKVDGFIPNLQRSLGNCYLQSCSMNTSIQPTISAKGGARVIQRKCSCGGSCASCSAKDDKKMTIQAKVKVGPANDVYEQEADRVAEQVMRMPIQIGQPKNAYTPPGMDIQRLTGTDSSGFTADINVNQSSGRSLSEATRSYMEPRFGVDFSAIRLYTDEQAQRDASDIQARAFTYGNGISLGRGEHESDRRLMAHELTHVVQQKGHRIRLSSRMGNGLEDGIGKDVGVKYSLIEEEKILKPHQTETRSIQRQGGGAAPANHRFTSEGVSVVLRDNCATTLGFAAVEAATGTALDRIFNSECIEKSRRTRIQSNLTKHGLDIRCSELDGDCAEATGFFIPANIMTLNTDRTGCPALESSVIHEIIHLTRGVFAERLPESCDNSCLGTQRGVPPDLCRDIDVFGKRVRGAP